VCTFKGRFPIVSIILAQKHQANINYRPIFEKKECFFRQRRLLFSFSTQFEYQPLFTLGSRKVCEEVLT
jgi:hypothetical protein